MQHVRAVANCFVIVLDPLGVFGNYRREVFFRESPQAEGVAGFTGVLGIPDDLVRRISILASDDIFEIRPPQRTVCVDDFVADGLILDIPFRLRARYWTRSRPKIVTQRPDM